MKNTTKKIENSAIFSTCHSLTKKLVFGTKYDYKSTFSASLALNSAILKSTLKKLKRMTHISTPMMNHSPN